MRAGPAASASELPRKPRRASIRSLRENSLSRATVWGPAQGRSTPATDGDWCAVRSPSCSMATTAPKRSENSSERMRGIGSRGCSPSSQRRTREVSVLMWRAPICRARRFTWRASSPLDQPLRTNHDPNCPLGRFPASVSPAPLPLTGTPPSRRNLIARTIIRMPCIGAVRKGVETPLTSPTSPTSSNRKSGCPRHTRGCTYSQGSRTDGNPTITPPARGLRKRHHSPPLRMNPTAAGRA